MSQDLVVELLDGLYQLPVPLRFSPKDSGTNGYYVRYEAAANAHPVLSGGLTIQGWTLFDAQKNIYKATVPAGFDTRQLYVNGVRSYRARLVLATAMPGNPILGDAATATSHGYKLEILGMTSWGNVRNIEAVMTNWWVQMRCPLASVSEGQIFLQDPCWSLANIGPTNMNKGLNWLENAYEFLREPGFWYLDRDANVIYYIPRDGENMATSKVVAGVLEQLIVGSGTLSSSGNPDFLENISFQGLTFAYATWLRPNSCDGFPELQSGVYRDATSVGRHRTPGAVTFSRAKHMVLAFNNFVHIGEAALNIDTGSQDATITGNVFSDISGGAITLGDPDDNLQNDAKKQSSGHSIKNNYIFETGMEYPGSSSVLLFYAANTLIENNEVSHVPYTGISLGWGWGAPSYEANNQINRNYIHDVMQQLFDGSAIYTLGSGGGSMLSANYMDTIGTAGTCSTSGSSYAGYSGIYHDTGGMLYTDIGNVVRHVSCAGYWMNLAWQDTDTTLVDDYVDIDSVLGCPGNISGTSVCLNVNGNSATGISLFGSQLSAAAQAIALRAGLTDEYEHIKDTAIYY